MIFEYNIENILKYERDFRKYNQIRKKVFRSYFRIYHRYEIIGLDNIPEGPALIATNHSGGFDLDIVALSDCTHPAREIHSLIAENWHFLNHAWGRYWVGGGIPLWTRGGIRWEYIDPYLEKGGVEYPGLVAIYPEGHSGTFRRRHVLSVFYPGVVRIAVRYRVPIVPVAMIGFHWASPIIGEIERGHGPNDIIPLPFTIPVKLIAEFGEPFELDDYYDRELSREEELRVANEVVRPRISEILKKHTKVVLGETDFEMKKPE